MTGTGCLLWLAHLPFLDSPAFYVGMVLPTTAWASCITQSSRKCPAHQSGGRNEVPPSYVCLGLCHVDKSQSAEALRLKDAGLGVTWQIKRLNELSFNQVFPSQTENPSMVHTISLKTSKYYRCRTGEGGAEIQTPGSLSEWFLSSVYPVLE